MFGIATFLRDFPSCRLVADRVHFPRGMHDQKPALIYHDPTVGDALDRHSLLGQRLAERVTVQRTLAHQFQRTLRKADRPHAVVDASRSQSALRDLEAAPLAKQDWVSAGTKAMRRVARAHVRKWSVTAKHVSR